MTAIRSTETTTRPRHMHAFPAEVRERMAGVLLHPTSLPGSYGIGDLGDEAIVFLDWAQSAGIRLWQVLPLNPPGFGASPYGCLSSFAGNGLLISPQRLLQDGLLEFRDVAEMPRFADDHVEFARVAEYKLHLLRVSWRRFQEGASDELRQAFEAFVSDPEQQAWLPSYALFRAIKDHEGGKPWWEWPADLAAASPEALERARATHAGEIRFREYVQFLFFRQWHQLREAAHARGIRVMGDIPIYVAHDSADVWGHRELFLLDESGHPTAVAGVPPDYFSITGQRWGNPLYRWDVMREEGFRWWVDRLRTNLRMADIVRLDHFRGFAAYWEVPASEETAVHGRWMPGPGLALFETLRRELGELPLVAEDLGFITDDVHELRRAIGLPGMKIVQFGFGQDDSPHLPHRFDCETVAYTGTHDNDTARGWFVSAPEVEQKRAMTYLGSKGEHDVAWEMIRATYTSVADFAIVPAQDILSLGSDARMNTPGAAHDNWAWRMKSAELTHDLAERLRELGVITGR